MITRVKRLHDAAVLPQYGYPGDAGMDLSVVGGHVLNPGESRDLPTGIAVQLPEGYWARITGRSSTLRKRGLFVNEGVIDEGYRGELLVYVTNRQSTPVAIASGDRLAQLILHPVHQAPAEWADVLDDSERGTNGFGSTGTAAMVSDGVKPDVRPTFAEGYVYLGGAVDVGGEKNHEWRHSRWWGMSYYCPICSCAGMDDPAEIVKRNTMRLDMADDAIFMLDGFSVGTPIEAYHRIVVRRKPAVVVWSRADRSVFIEWFRTFSDVRVVATLEEAASKVSARARRRESRVNT